MEIQWPKVRVVIDPGAGTVTMDGVQTQHDLSHLDPEIRLIQWWPEGWGQVEFRMESERGTVTTTDFNLVLPYIGLHEGAVHEQASRQAEVERAGKPAEIG